MQHSGESLDINVWVRHPQCLSRAHLGIQLINQFQTAATEVHGYPPDCNFGGEPGTSLLRFRIPCLRLNIGKFYLRIWLTGPPGGGKVHEIVETCDFEVVRAGSPIWWRPETCGYHEEFSVMIENEPNRGSSEEWREIQMASTG